MALRFTVIVSMLSLESVTVTYPGRNPLRFDDRRLAAGQQALLLGASGSGKSSLLQVIAGLQVPSSGTVRVEGQPINQWSEASRDRFRGRRIGIVFQRLHLIGALNVKENLMVAQTCAGLPRDRARVSALLAALGVAELASARPHQLSGGQQQRVAIARALVNRPALVLADEPTASLDDANADTVLALLAQEAERNGAALLIATHDARALPRFPLQWRLDL